MAQQSKVYVHRNSWAEPFNPSRDTVTWNAHRPLLGDKTWEGKSRWGTHYATSQVDHPDFARWAANNVAMDAREVVTLTNMDSVVLAGRLAVDAGRGDYGLAAYVNAYPGAEGAKMFVETYDLPWDDADTTAEPLLAALATA
jgi:hypothetical protein